MQKVSDRDDRNQPIACRTQTETQEELVNFFQSLSSFQINGKKRKSKQEHNEYIIRDIHQDGNNV